MKKIKKFGSGSWEMKKTGHERKGESYILKTEESTEGIFWENTGVLLLMYMTTEKDRQRRTADLLK